MCVKGADGGVVLSVWEAKKDEFQERKKIRAAGSLGGHLLVRLCPCTCAGCSWPSRRRAEPFWGRLGPITTFNELLLENKVGNNFKASTFEGAIWG